MEGKVEVGRSALGFSIRGKSSDEAIDLEEKLTEGKNSRRVGTYGFLNDPFKFQNGPTREQREKDVSPLLRHFWVSITKRRLALVEAVIEGSEFGHLRTRAIDVVEGLRVVEMQLSFRQSKEYS
jgi:hypothetical protein